MFEHSGRRFLFRRAYATLRRGVALLWPEQKSTDITIDRAFSRRALLVAGVQAGLFGFLGYRLHTMQVGSSLQYRQKADDNRFFEHPIAPRRGNIRDRNGLVLAESIEDLQVTITPDLAKDLHGTLLKLGRIVQIDDADRARVAEIAGKQPRLLPILVRGDLTWDEFSRISLLGPEMPGVEAAIGWSRQYSRSADTGLVVGYVGKGDQAEVDKEPLLRLAGQRVGKVGVELGMEPTLRGSPGLVRREVNAQGRIIRDLERQPPVAGRTIDLTIDTNFQGWLLDRMRREDWSAIVAMDCRNGEIVAVGSTPTYDPTVIMNGISAKDWNELHTRPGNPLVNKAVRGLYPPGSTYKIVTALAGLQAGVIDEKFSVVCRGAVVFGGATFRCWKSSGHGRVNLRNALAGSCDCYFYETARMLGIDRLAEAGRVLGFGSAHGLGIAPEPSGIVPDPIWKSNKKVRPWMGGETLIAGIGQGYVLTTPLQLALMTARVASGRMLKPTLVRPALTQPMAPPLPYAEEHLALVRRGLEAVVNDGDGTGKHAYLSSVRVAGKTGTAQVTRLSTSRSNDDLPRQFRDHALFVGYAPAEAPVYAVAGIVEHGGSGGTTAAPLVRDVLRALISQDPAARGVAAAPAETNRDRQAG